MLPLMQVIMQTMTIFWKINAHMIVEATSEVIEQSNLEFLMLIKVCSLKSEGLQLSKVLGTL